jgi:hypothetical protein
MVRPKKRFLLVFVSLATAQAEVDFNQDIRPILSQNCYICHGFDAHKRKADLRLDLAEGAYAEVIVPGKPGESEFVARIAATDPDDIMPPPDSHKKLKDEEIALLIKWIAEGAEYAEAWAYVPPKTRPLPEVKNTNWASNWIDRFVLASLEKHNLLPSPDAKPATLVRRLFFDLSGLPPPPRAVNMYVSSEDSVAYEKMVDELLDADQYGERMAMYWLDLVRFADTVGYHGDQTHNTSPYRDYVMDAFNDNMPFDQFTREQLAGDLLPGAGVDQEIATCYNRLLQTSHEGGVQAKEYIAIYQADRVRNLSGVWMGATVGCAQCHDHKYDPYSIKDHYALAAFFADIDDTKHLKNGTNANPTRREPEIAVHSRRERALPETERPKPRRVMTTQALATPRTVRVLPRGNWQDDSGDVVLPAVPTFMPQIITNGKRATRLDLANWLCDPEQGIGGPTARVMVNRLWYLFFASGLAGVLDDFGGQGEAPVHPELLDQLAVRFYESGWDTKLLVKEMVMSRTYRQASIASEVLAARDPYNRLLARQSRYRLPAEMIRDNALRVSGLLNLAYGGASARPYQPQGYYRHLNFPTRKYSPHTDSQQWRRGVYMHWQRMFLHPMLRAMDAPTREECTAQRSQSNTPSFALVLLNDPTFVEAARAFAERCLREGGKTMDQRITFMVRNALSRPPDAEEYRVLKSHLERELSEYATDKSEAEKLVSTGLSPVARDLDVVELAAWTNIARVLMNGNEFNFRN